MLVDDTGVFLRLPVAEKCVLRVGGYGRMSEKEAAGRKSETKCCSLKGVLGMHAGAGN